jgi:hypothetical protein
LPENYFIKRPQLNIYILSKPIKINNKILKKIIILEIFKIYLYLNIIKYIDYQIYNNRIVGIYVVQRYIDNQSFEMVKTVIYYSV